MKPTVADNRNPNLLILLVPAAPSFLDTEEVRGSSPPGPTIFSRSKFSAFPECDFSLGEEYNFSLRELAPNAR